MAALHPCLPTRERPLFLILISYCSFFTCYCKIPFKPFLWTYFAFIGKFSHARIKDIFNEWNWTSAGTWLRQNQIPNEVILGAGACGGPNPSPSSGHHSAWNPPVGGPWCFFAYFLSNVPWQYPIFFSTSCGVACFDRVTPPKPTFSAEWCCDMGAYGDTSSSEARHIVQQPATAPSDGDVSPTSYAWLTS